MRLIVVEDEPIARDGLCAMLAAEHSVEVVGSFANAEAARRGVRNAMPDGMFVDVEMPGEGGLDFVRSIPAASRPHVVFVTAHENYAVNAFDVDAIDYVLKPIDERRLSESVARVRKAVEDNATARMHLTRISARVNDRLVVVRLTDVSWIEADGDYMRVHSNGRALLVRMTMRELEHRLDPSAFVRAHRSALVNLDFVTSVELLSHGEHIAVLRDGSRVRVGRSYRPALFDALGERT